MSLNKVMLIGNVGADPEIRYLAGSNPQENVKVASLRLATSERYRDRNSNETKEVTEWHSITAWRGLADIIEKYVRKGTQIYVEGRLRTRSWTDRDNNTRYSTEIVADSLQLLGRRGDNPAAGQASPLPQTGPADGAEAGRGTSAQPSSGQCPTGSPVPSTAGVRPVSAPPAEPEPDDDLPF